MSAHDHHDARAPTGLFRWVAWGGMGKLIWPSTNLRNIRAAGFSLRESFGTRVFRYRAHPCRHALQGAASERHKSFVSLCLTVLTVFVAVDPAIAGPTRAELAAEVQHALADFDQAHKIRADQPDRARQLFRSAAQRFQTIAAAGVSNGRLEYDLGNCLLQAGDLGEAVLHYRRAERLIPGDPLLADNLAEARSRCLTSIKPTRRSRLLRSLFFWHHDISLPGRSKAALTLYLVFWGLLTLGTLRPRRSLTIAAIACGIVCVAMAGSVAATGWSDRHAAEGVITDMDVVVYKGPGTGYQRQFEQPLQPGVEFTLREARRDWWNIDLADGNTGWVESTTAELITKPSERLQLWPT